MATKKEQVIETRLGKRTIFLDKVLFFPRGLIGFERYTHYILLELKEDSPLLMLQSIDNAKVGLLVADPYSFTKEYQIKVSEAEKRILKLNNLRQVAVLVTVTIPAGHPEKTALNLMGPILVNYEARVGVQVPQVDTGGPTHIYLHEHMDQAAGGEQ